MSIKIIFNDDRLWYQLFWSRVLIYAMSWLDMTWYNVTYFLSLCEVMWCDVICKYVLQFFRTFSYQCNYFLHYLYCINFFFTFLPYLAAAHLTLSYLTLSYLTLSYLTLSYLTLSYLLWFNLAHFILFLSRFQLDLQMRIFMFIMLSFSHSTWREYRKRRAVVTLL